MKKFGVTLIEICLAILIMGAALLPIFGMLTSSNSASRLQKAEGVAANLAKEKMNELLFSLSPTNFQVLTTVKTDLFQIEGNEYQVESQVFPHANTSFKVYYPEVLWHNMRDCTGGKEFYVLSGATYINDHSDKTIQDVTQVTYTLVYDVILKVQWRLPNGAFNDTNRMILVSRKGFAVKKGT
ncbi:MAG: hypothetical protein WA705_21535 [Candidatus Ozemobacteraceae bacterium]